MPTDVFELHIQQSLQKLEKLWRRSEAIPNPDSQLWQNTTELPQQQQQLLRESLDELSASIEELQLATETIREQNEELILNRQQLVLEKQYYQELFDSAPDCYIITSKSGTITEVNYKTTELLGISAEFLTNKALAVFISRGQKPEYYAKLKQIQQGKISEATWQLEIIPRQQNPITVECMVSAISDRMGEMVALRWRIHPIKINNNAENTVNYQDFTSTLIKALRYPIYNLVTEIKEIQTSEQATLLRTDRRLQLINSKIVHLKHTVNNAYIIECLNNTQDLNLSLVDYAVFIRRLIRQFQQSDSQLQQIVFNNQDSCVGICDVFLLNKILTNILTIGLKYTGDSQIQINLSQDSTSNLRLRIDVSILKSTIKKLSAVFTPLITNNIEPTSEQDLNLMAVYKSVQLLQGNIELKDQESSITITIYLPLITVNGDLSRK
jgi:PAS domain S-box-containing protein